MINLTFITGGTRSGKSSFAMGLAKEESQTPVYLATARVWDEDFKKRIDRHKNDRGAEWITMEEEIDIDKLSLNGKCVVLDCITLWLTNIFHDNDYDIDNSLKQAKTIWDSLMKKECRLIVVSNELGMGVHAMDNITRKFTDLQGFVNQHIASAANEVFLMVSGIPVKIK